MIIYRIQNKEGSGPYSSWGWKQRDHTRYNNRPAIDWENENEMKNCLDLGLRINQGFTKGFIFGFSSKKKLAKWFFKDERALLKTKGYEVYRIEVKDSKEVIKAERQLMFDKKKIVSETIINI